MKSRFIRSNTTWPGIAFILLLVVLVSALSGYAVFHLFLRPGPNPAEASDLASFYAQLDLSPQQQTEVAAIDARFESERIALMRSFEQARRELADHLAQHNSYTPEIASMVQKVHHLHGELQALSIRRYFTILENLPPPQRSQMRKLAADTLSRPQ